MTHYKKMYEEKLTTADELAARVESGWSIGMDTSVSAAPAIVSAIARRAADGALDGLTVQTILDAYPFEFYADESLRGKMTGMSWFSGGGARRAINGGWADILPAYYRDIPKLIRENYEYDVVLLSVSPMDKHGYFSLATANSYTEALLDRTKRVFLEVNSFQPRAICGGQVHISRVDGLIEHNAPLPVMAPAKIDPVSETIGNIIAEQIPDGACIQLGIGAIPDATGMALKSKHDLGIHTELFTDSMVELIECGAVNNSRKQIVTPVYVSDEEFIADWKSLEYTSLGFSPDYAEYYTDNGERVRSKSEIIIANKLYRYNIPYRYECPLQLQSGVITHPDFTCLNVSTRQEYIWEHFGIMDNAEYACNAIRKINDYANSGYILGKNFIATFETSNTPINANYIDDIIRTNISCL